MGRLESSIQPPVERGERNVSLDNIHAIANALEVSAARLVDD